MLKCGAILGTAVVAAYISAYTSGTVRTEVVQSGAVIPTAVSRMTS